MTNVLIALTNIVENPIVDLRSFYTGSNRANNMGDALETYIKDVFCNSFDASDQEKDKAYSQYFSYLGNQNNPPDIILRNGDAIEVKKIESSTSALALNSSYPKDKLHADDSRITEHCKACEKIPWTQKDILYVVGVAPKGTDKLKALWFVYGDCYAARREIYQRIADKISSGISEISDVEFVETNELAKVKKVDPLGITDLRVRGMWHIENPLRVFGNIASADDGSDFTVNALLLREKYDAFPVEDQKRLEDLQGENLKIREVEIRSPNNPAELMRGKVISFAR